MEAQTRARLGIAPDEWVLYLWAGCTISRDCGRSFRPLPNDPALLDGARLLVVGDGDIYPELTALVEQHALAPRILMTGKRPYQDIPALLAASDVALMPSVENSVTREIVPMKIYEYLAAGKPVSASRLPGMLAEFGPDQERGILYGDHPVEVFRNALALREHPEKVAHLSQSGRKTAEENADWEKTTDQFEQILLSMIAVS